MGRRRSRGQSGDGAAGELGGGSPAPLAPVVGDLAPPRYVGGRTNPEYLKWAYRQVNELSVGVARGEREMPSGYNLAQAEKLLDSEARYVAGVDPKALRDARTPEQALHDAAREFAANPDSVFDWTEAMLAAMEREMDNADEGERELLGGVNSEAAREARVELLKKKRCAAILARCRRLQDRARSPVPAREFKGDGMQLAAAHILRFAVYVGRNPAKSGAEAVLQVASHHCKMAAETYQAEQRRVYYQGEWVEQDCDGLMLIVPPGHGKTTFLIHRTVLRTAQNPKRRVVVLHANADEAAKSVQFIGSYFDPNDAPGRRVRALFPEVPPLARRSMSEVRFVLPEAQRQPAFQAYGINANAAGADCDELLEDDACDQKLAEQELERKRTFDRLNGTWERRKRGKAQTFIATTLWHHDDPNSRWLELAKRDKCKFRALILRCGGPDSSPPFKAVWPEEYPPSKLRSIYGTMRNARLYAACYECNPLPEGLKKVKRLSYYLPGDEAHRTFLARAAMYLSLDPTATNRERADKAAFVYAGVGDVVSRGKDGSTVIDRRMRVLDAREFHANQTEGVDEICGFAEGSPVHYTIVETRSGFNASAEILEARGVDVVRHDPKNRKKDLRLGDVAPMLDDSLRDRGFPGASVEFPGRLCEDGSIGPDPESPLLWVEQQLLEFGATDKDHAVDALVQLCKEVGPTLGVGEDSVLQPVIEQERVHPDPRIDRMIKFFGTPREERFTPEEEESRWWAGHAEEAL